MTHEFLAELWSTFRGYIDKLHIEIAAYQFVQTIMDHYDDDELLIQLREIDVNLDHAISEYIENGIEEIDDEDM